VIANQRKGKLIFFYEVVVKLKWKGETADGTAVNGTIDCINLSEENDDDDLEFVTKLTSDETPERRKVRAPPRPQTPPIRPADLASNVSLRKPQPFSVPA